VAMGGKYCKCCERSFYSYLPEILKNISGSNFNFVLDFYEQGVEQEVIFTQEEKFALVTCKSNTDWIPNPITINMKLEELLSMINNLYNDFIRFSEELCSNLITHRLFKEWKES